MTFPYDPVTPWQRQHIAARDPYMARNTLGITTWIDVDETAPQGSEYGGPYELIAGSGVSFTFGTQLFGTAHRGGVTRKTLTLSAAGGGGGVSSINTLTGALTIAAGTGINVANAGTTITISAPLFAAATQGEVPASGGGTVNFLRADGAWAAALTGNQTITLSGDVTGSGATAITATIANNAVTNAKLADVATATFKGRVTAATGDPEDLTGTQATTLLDVFTSTLKGLAPSSGGGTTNFLRADGTWNAPAGGGNVSNSGTPTLGQLAQWTDATHIKGMALPGYLGGLTLVYATVNTLTVNAGGATSDDNTTVMILASALTKNTVATWAVGAAGGLDAGTVAASTWYHVFLIERTDTGVVDVLFSTSASSPTMPASYTKKRRIGSFKTDAGFAILNFVQNGDMVLLATPIAILNSASLGAGGSQSLSLAASAPTGVKTQAIFTAFYNPTAAGTYYLEFHSPDQSSTTVNSPAGNINMWAQGASNAPGANNDFQIWTDTSAAIRIGVGVASADGFYLVGKGWIDNRGK